MEGLCYTCLSKDRNVKVLDSFLIKRTLCEWFQASGKFNVNVDEYKLCWECCAHFLKLNKFKRQVFKAYKKMKKIAKKKRSRLVKLSQLDTFTKNTFDSTIEHDENANGSNSTTSQVKSHDASHNDSNVYESNKHRSNDKNEKEENMSVALPKIAKKKEMGENDKTIPKLKMKKIHRKLSYCIDFTEDDNSSNDCENKDEINTYDPAKDVKLRCIPYVVIQTQDKIIETSSFISNESKTIHKKRSYETNDESHQKRPKQVRDTVITCVGNTITVCADCDMELHTPQLLTTHYETAHKETLECNQCAETIDTCTGMEEHAASHTVNVEEYTERTEHVDKRTEDIEDRTEDVEDSTEDVEERTEDVEERTEDFVERTEDFVERTEDFVERTEDVEECTEDVEERTEYVEERTEDVEECTEDVEESTEDFEERTEDVEECIEDVEECTEDVEERTEDVEERTEDFEERTEDVEERIEDVEERTEDVEECTEDVEERKEDVEERTEDFEERTEDVEERIEDVEQRTEDVEERIEDVEERTEHVEESAERIENRKEHVDVETLKCKRCNCTFEGKATFRTHMQFTHKKLAHYAYCTDCDLQFSGVNKYKQHLKESKKHNRSEELKFDCAHCNSNYLTEETLLAHIIRAHRLLSHTCALCNKGFSDPIRLKRHIGAKHPEVIISVKPAKDKICPICSKGFVARSALLYHISTHKAKKPFQCEGCDKRFAVETILKKHVHRSHQDKESN